MFAGAWMPVVPEMLMILPLLLGTIDFSASREQSIAPVSLVAIALVQPSNGMSATELTSRAEAAVVHQEAHEAESVHRCPKELDHILFPGEVSYDGH